MISFAFILFLAISLLCWPAYWIVLGKLRFLHHLPSTENHLRISVIIPARNEAHNLPRLLESLNEQTHPPHEVLVVDDDSTDATADVARTHHARVIQSKTLPEGWLGKPWACTQGAEAAQGEWYLFLDADTWLEPHALRQLQAATEQGQHGKYAKHGEQDTVISVSPYHAIQKPYEELSAFFNTLMVAGVNAFGAKPDPSLFGQCLLISCAHYQQVGGHNSVKHEVLENFQLSQTLREQNIPRQCYLGKGTISMRMFPEGYSQLCKSWQKGFHLGAKKTNKGALLFSSLWISGAMFFCVATIILLVAIVFQKSSSLPIPQLTVCWLVLYALYTIQCFSVFRSTGAFSYLNALLFPISLLFYQVIFFHSILQKKRNKPTDWKGRSVH